MSTDRIFVRDFDCYKKATEEEKNWKLLNPSQSFDLTKIPSDNMREEMRLFLMYRGEKLGLKSIRTEFWKYNLLCRYLNDTGMMGSFKGVDAENEVMQYKKWLKSHGYSIARRHKRGNSYYWGESEEIGFYRFLLEYYSTDDRAEKEKDVWKLANLDREPRQNPSKRAETLSFKGIARKGIRDEVKMAVSVLLDFHKTATLQAEISAMNRFCNFLIAEFPEVETLSELNRSMMEEYLIHLNTAVKKKSNRTELHHLKTVLEMVGKTCLYPNLQNIILFHDIPKAAKTLYKSYSDHEIRKLNEAIIREDVQTARAWILQGILGTRISEVLSLSADCIIGEDMIYIMQPKTEKGYEKKVNSDVIKLITGAEKQTRERYGNRVYIFVSEKDPDKPMPYGTFYGRIRKIIDKNDLRDDNGRPFTVGTHLLRHSYGRRLAEMGYDDIIIAKLLGHKSLQAVQYYRKLDKEYMAQETSAHRARKDAILTDILKGW